MVTNRKEVRGASWLGGVKRLLDWEAVSVVALGNCGASLFVREGDGHEILLEGDEE